MGTLRIFGPFPSHPLSRGFLAARKGAGFRGPSLATRAAGPGVVGRVGRRRHKVLQSGTARCPSLSAAKGVPKKPVVCQTGHSASGMSGSWQY